MRSALLLFALAGCDLLFPEFAGKPPPDAGGSDGGTSPHIAGVLCALGNLRDYRSCGGAVGSAMHVSVEETRDTAPADGMGHFNLPLSQMLSAAILAAADGSRQFTPTVTTVALSGGSVDGLAVPLISAQTLQVVAQQNGVALDPRKGCIFGWATDVRGNPLANLVAGPLDGADGPYYDGAQASEIAPGVATSAHGLVAFFNVPPGNASFTAGAGHFTLPVRENAVTLSVLITAP